VRVISVNRLCFFSLIYNNIVPFVDSGSVDPETSEATDYHFGVFITRKLAQITNNTPIDIAFIVEDSPAARSAAN
jgi:hypothetical protein